MALLCLSWPAAARALSAPLLALVAGCGSSGPPLGTVSGTVTYGGRPVTEGEVHINSAAAGVGAVAAIGGTGRFEFGDPLPVGTYEAWVWPAIAHPIEGEPAKKKRVALPTKAQNPKTSGLTIEVREGSGEVTLELKD